MSVRSVHSLSAMGCLLLLLQSGLITLLSVGSLPAQEIAPDNDFPATNLLTIRSSVTAERKLKLPASYRATNLPLRDVLASFRETYQLSIWLDRRIDPTTEINLQLGDPVPLETVLRQIATLGKSEFSLVENVCYIGPRGSGPRLQLANLRLHRSITQQFGERQSNRPRSFSWDELTKPNELVQQTGKDAGLGAIQEVPHDLMHAGALAAGCTSATFLSLIAGGFDKAYRIENKKLVLVELAPQSTWRSNYPRKRLNQNVAQRVKDLPGTIVESPTGWGVTGNTRFHRTLLYANLQPAADRPQTGRLSGEISGTVENIAKQIATAMRVDLTWDASVNAKLRGSFLKFEVKNLTYDEILEKLADSAGLTLLTDSSAGTARLTLKQD